MAGETDTNNSIAADDDGALLDCAQDNRRSRRGMPEKLAAYLARLSENSRAKNLQQEEETLAAIADSVEKQTATQEFAALVKERYAQGPAPDRKPRRRILMIAALGACCALLFTVWSVVANSPEQPAVLSGTIEAKEITMACKVTGRVESVLVEEGQIVKAGQPIVELTLPELEARRRKQQAEIDLREARLLELTHGARSSEIQRARAAAEQAYLNWQMLKNGYRSEDIGMARAQRQEVERQLALLETGYRSEDIEQAKAQMEEKQTLLDYADRDYRRYQGLAADGAVSSREADEMKTKMEAAKSALQAAAKNYAKFKLGPRSDEISAAAQRLKFAQEREQLMIAGPRAEQIGISWQQYLQAKAILDLLNEGTRSEQLAQSKAALAEAQAELLELDAQLEDRVIRSPADAEVSVLDLHKGQISPANKPMLKLTRLDNVWIRVYIPEQKLSRVRMGQKVELKADSYPGRTFYGKIVQIPSTAEFTPRNIQTDEERAAQVFGLKVNIDNHEGLLRGGMNAEVVLPASAPPSTPMRGIALWQQ